MTAVAFEAVSRTFPPARRGQSPIRAVRDVSFTLAPGEFVGLVGQSGSGKSTVARMAAMLDFPTDGTVRVAGADPSSLSARQLRTARMASQFVFQDPFDSLDPRWTVRQTVEEPLRSDAAVSNTDRDAAVDRMLDQVGLRPAAQWADRHPHELSGGQRQRVAIARALVARPSLIVADEPVSMLDVSVRAGILQLFQRIRDLGDAACLFVTHDLAVARYISDRLLVMRDGQVVEAGPADQVIEHPQHEYTRLLIDKASSLEDQPAHP